MPSFVRAADRSKGCTSIHGDSQRDGASHAPPFHCTCQAPQRSPRPTIATLLSSTIKKRSTWRQELSHRAPRCLEKPDPLPVAAIHALRAQDHEPRVLVLFLRASDPRATLVPTSPSLRTKTRRGCCQCDDRVPSHRSIVPCPPGLCPRPCQRPHPIPGLNSCHLRGELRAQHRYISLMLIDVR